MTSEDSVKNGFSVQDFPVTGAAAAIDSFLEAFGGRWPPRPSFDWPECLQKYHALWEEATTQVKEINNPEAFRQWMQKELNTKVNLAEVMEELQTRLQVNNPVTLAFQACLQHVICFYRWGALPTTEEERKRTELVIPEQLWTPFVKISELFGTTAACCIFNLTHANVEYSSETNKPVKRHFWWNSDVEIRRSENNFFLSFVLVDNAFNSCLQTIHDYLVYTDAARNNPDMRKSLLNKRLEVLQTLKTEFMVINKLFIDSIQKKGEVDKEVFPDYIQNMAAWGLDGKGGASGAEALTFALLDEFFDLSGNSDAYVGAYGKRGNMTRHARELLEVMAVDHRDDRFDSFIGLDLDNLLIEAKDQLIHAIYVWRLGHARSSTQFMEKSKITASKIVESSLQEGETLAERGLFIGTVRARETAQKITNRKFAIPDMDTPAGY